MNLYIVRRPGRMGHVCSKTNAEIRDAEGTIIGYATGRLADHLIRIGEAMDITPSIEDAANIRVNEARH